MMEKTNRQRNKVVDMHVMGGTDQGMRCTIVKDAQVMGMKCGQMGVAGSMELGEQSKDIWWTGGEGKLN